MATFTGHIKRYFISGVLVVVPLILTYIVLKFLFEAIDGILQPHIHRVFGYYFWGLGIITTLLLILLAGVFTRNYIGARIYSIGDRLLGRMPIIRPIYGAAKQLLEALAAPRNKTFREVGLVQYPRPGMWALCFVAKPVQVEVPDGIQEHQAVFIPSTPTPVSGMVLMVPSEEVVLADMSIEEGIKFLVSGGVASPDTIRRKRPPAEVTEKEV